MSTARSSAENADDPIQPYDSDHTALVHVLWEARRKGLRIEDADELASLIMRSRWTRAVRQHEREKPTTVASS